MAVSFKLIPLEEKLTKQQYLELLDNNNFDWRECTETEAVRAARDGYVLFGPLQNSTEVLGVNLKKSDQVRNWLNRTFKPEDKEALRKSVQARRKVSEPSFLETVNKLGRL